MEMMDGKAHDEGKISTLCGSPTAGTRAADLSLTLSTAGLFPAQMVSSRSKQALGLCLLSNSPFYPEHPCHHRPAGTAWPDFHLAKDARPFFSIPLLYLALSPGKENLGEEENL